MSLDENESKRDVVDTVSLNVGGTIFTTFKSTLTDHSLYFRQLLLSKEYKASSCHFIDRCPKLFEAVLNTLRDSSYKTPSELSENLDKEYLFYGIKATIVADKPTPSFIVFEIASFDDPHAIVNADWTIVPEVHKAFLKLASFTEQGAFLVKNGWVLWRVSSIQTLKQAGYQWFGNTQVELTLQTFRSWASMEQTDITCGVPTVFTRGCSTTINSATCPLSASCTHKDGIAYWMFQSSASI